MRVASFLAGSLAGLVLASSPVQSFNDGQKPDELPASGRAPRDVLVVSGGISLGSYEAGVNWATVRLLKSPTPGRPANESQGLKAAAGASAGNANVLLAALTYCQSPATDLAERVDENLFWKAWIPVGLDSLFTGTYRDDDGLFTRAAYEPIKDMLRSRIEPEPSGEPRYLKGCSVDVGLTLTRRRPQVTRDPDVKLNLLDPNAWVAFKVQTTQDFRGAEFLPIDDAGLPDEEPSRHPTKRRDPRYLVLRRDDLGRVGFEDVVAAVEASSAFPVAFGPREIFHCTRDSGPRHRDETCPEGFRTISEPFVDGGVFDNLPLALGSDLLARGLSARDWVPAGENARFFTIDPDYRRPFGAAPSRRHDLKRSLEFYGDVLGNLVTVARQEEIRSFARTEAALRGRKLIGDNTFRVSSRYGPIHGEHAANFAAFFALPFREYDFYVGFYDGVFDWVRHECIDLFPCDEGEESSCTELAKCMVERAKDAHDTLLCPAGRCEGKSADASFVFRDLLEREAKTTLRKSALAEVARHELKGGLTAADFLRNDRHPSPLMVALHDANLELDERLRPDAHGGLVGPAAVSSEDPFSQLRELLIKHGASKLLDPAEAEVVDDYDRWIRDRTVEAAWRLTDIEKAEDLPGMEVPRELAEAVLQAERSFRHVGADTDPSSIPEDAAPIAHLLPYQVMFDLRNGGIELGWRPTMGVHRWVGFGFPFGFEYLWRGKNERSLAGVGLNLIGRPGGQWGWFVSSVEAGPKLMLELPLTETSREHPGDYAVGGEGTVTLLGKFRVGALVRSRFQPDPGSPDDLFIVGTVGVGDVNGLAYWIARLGTKQSAPYTDERLPGRPP